MVNEFIPIGYSLLVSKGRMYWIKKNDPHTYIRIKI